MPGKRRVSIVCRRGLELVSSRIFDTFETIMGDVCEIWNNILAQPQQLIQSRCGTGHVSVNHYPARPVLVQRGIGPQVGPVRLRPEMG